MLSARQATAGVIAGLTAVLTAACGTDHHTIVHTPAFAPASAALRYPDGSPERAAMQLLLTLEYNDPTAAATFFVPRWKLTSDLLAKEIHGALGGLGGIIGANPRPIADIRKGNRATLVLPVVGGKRLFLTLEHTGGSWKLSGARLGPLVLAAPAAGHARR